MDRSDLEVRYHCRKLDAHLLRKPEQVLFWLCGTFLCQTYSLPFSCSRTSLQTGPISPALRAAENAARPTSNLPNITLQLRKETYLLLRYLFLQ